MVVATGCTRPKLCVNEMGLEGGCDCCSAFGKAALSRTHSKSWRTVGWLVASRHCSHAKGAEFTRGMFLSSLRERLQSDFNNVQQFLPGRTGGRLNSQSKVNRLHVVRQRVRVRIR